MDLPLTIKETQEGLVKKKFSAVDLVDSYIERIDKFNKDLNIFLTLSKDEAYKKAKWVDEILKELGDKAIKEYPLLGVTVAHKDLFLTKGIRTTAASKVLENYIPTYSGTAVKRTDGAGAIILGKTNCDAWAHGGSGENSDFGPTKNPWNRQYVPGGSSSGSAAAVSANMTLFATGTDTGGSIRQPASFCGLIGLKPTYGAVSRYGVVAMESSFDTVGHITRTVEDAETIFNIIKGKDGLDSTIIEDRYSEPKTKLRIGIAKEFFGEGLDKEIEKIILKAIAIYKKLGIEFVKVSLPNLEYAISVYYIIMTAGVSSNLGRYDGVRYGNDRGKFGDEAKRRIMLGSYVLSAGYYDAYYLKAAKVRSKIIEDFNKVYEKVDAIIAPVSPTPAFKLGEKISDPLKMYLADIYTAEANIAGIPGITIPYGFTKENLPLGFQLLGPQFSENTLFSLGKAFEKATDYKPMVAKL